MALSKRRRTYWSESDFTTQLAGICISGSQLSRIVDVLQRTTDDVSEQHRQGPMHDNQKFWYVTLRADSAVLLDYAYAFCIVVTYLTSFNSLGPSGTGTVGLGEIHVLGTGLTCQLWNPT